MKVLALDLSLRRTGYSVLDSKKKLIVYGGITTSPKLSDAERISKIADEILSIAKRYKVKAGAVEDVFFKLDAQVVKKLSRLRGAVENLLLKKLKVKLEPIMATTARASIGISGRAQKIEVQLFVSQRYKLTKRYLIREFKNKFKKLKEKLGKEEITKSSFKSKALKLSKEFERRSNITEDIADSIVMGLSYLARN